METCCHIIAGHVTTPVRLRWVHMVHLWNILHEAYQYIYKREDGPCRNKFHLFNSSTAIPKWKMLYGIYRKTSLLSARQLSCFSTQCIFGQKFYVNIQSFSEHHQIAGKNHKYLYTYLLILHFTRIWFWYNTKYNFFFLQCNKRISYQLQKKSSLYLLRF